MNSVIAFFKLIRWPNLVFIVLTQFIFRFSILPFVYQKADPGYESIKLNHSLFILLVIASVCIAAAGYIINDYFDVNIDQINKAGKVIVGNFIRKRSAILLHALLSLVGFALSLYVGKQLHNYYIPFFNLVAILALLFYSTTFKKKLLVGNIIISLLTAWVIVILALAEFRFRISSSDVVWQELIKITIIYAGFAFIISLIREVIKDMEDVRGDIRYGCTTMPILWGLQVSKMFIAVWIIVLASSVTAIQFYALQLRIWVPGIYCLFFIIAPLIWVLFHLYKAKTSKQFHQLSTVVKLIMLSGILSMVFFKFFR
ncbi:MAG: geranylgeranylglycerol-phosphate geranylgeranyltransferase [Ginsengibacter sp.]